MIEINRQSLMMACLVLAACNPQPAEDEEKGDGTTDVPGENASGAFFLPTGEPDNTGAPTVEIDAAGGIHAVYPAYAGGGAYYAYCASDCRGTDDVEVVRLPTTGSVANAMLALDGAGHPQVLLSTAQDVYYASCTGDCTDASAWTTSVILAHGGLREVTGEAFAVDPEGRPRFLMHTYVAYLGVGQKPHETFYVTCDAGCQDGASWSANKLADQIWKYSKLIIDDAGRARAGTIATVEGGENGAAYQDMGAYLECDGACESGESWTGQLLAPAFSNDLDAIPVKPAISLALTDSGAPRVALLSKDEFSQRNIVFMACDADCTETPWQGTVIRQDNQIGAGIDLALDAAGHPRFAYTFGYNIFLAECDDTVCATDDATWNLEKVEIASELPPDAIFLYANCNVAAWFLHSPSLALTPSGAPRVGYQARDISGGNQNPDPNDEIPDCSAGTDMTWSRLAIL